MFIDARPVSLSPHYSDEYDEWRTFMHARQPPCSCFPWVGERWARFPVTSCYPVSYPVGEVSSHAEDINQQFEVKVNKYCRSTGRRGPSECLVSVESSMLSTSNSINTNLCWRTPDSTYQEVPAAGVYSVVSLPWYTRDAEYTLIHEHQGLQLCTPLP